MNDHIAHIADGFWNVRGSYKAAGLLDVGTQSSLVRLSSGRFVLLDCYAPTGRLLDTLLSLTDQGRAVEAIINLHPFHTLHVEACARQFPNARLYGTARHLARAPGLRWQAELTDSPAFHELFSADLSFMVPRGVEFIPPRDSVHFSSVLAFHPASRTLHVDDTLMWVNLPLIGGLRFHPSLGSALARRAGAASEFRSWANDLAERCADVEQVCTAHTKPLPPRAQPHDAQRGGGVASWVHKALARCDKVLNRHEQRFG